MAKRNIEGGRSRATWAVAAKPNSERSKRKRRRITDGLIGLSSAAVLAVYGMGYLATQHTFTLASNGNLAASQTAAALQQHRDGTFVATGTSRHGDIQATVVIQNGKIISADVSACGTRYPCSDVNALVSEAVSRQSAPVDHVSGATDSSRAYTQAIQNALAKASQ